MLSLLFLLHHHYPRLLLLLLLLLLLHKYMWEQSAMKVVVSRQGIVCVFVQPARASRECGVQNMEMDAVRSGVSFLSRIVDKMPPLGQMQLWINFLLNNIHVTALHRKYNDIPAIATSPIVTLLKESVQEVLRPVSLHSVRWIHYEDRSTSVRQCIHFF